MHGGDSRLGVPVALGHVPLQDRQHPWAGATPSGGYRQCKAKPNQKLNTLSGVWVHTVLFKRVVSLWSASREGSAITHLRAFTSKMAQAKAIIWLMRSFSARERTVLLMRIASLCSASRSFSLLWYRCRAKQEHTSQSRPDYGLGLSHFRCDSPQKKCFFSFSLGSAPFC